MFDSRRCWKYGSNFVSYRYSRQYELGLLMIIPCGKDISSRDYSQTELATSLALIRPASSFTQYVIVFFSTLSIRTKEKHACIKMRRTGADSYSTSVNIAIGQALIFVISDKSSLPSSRSLKLNKWTWIEEDNGNAFVLLAIDLNISTNCYCSKKLLEVVHQVSNWNQRR